MCFLSRRSHRNTSSGYSYVEPLPPTFPPFNLLAAVCEISRLSGHSFSAHAAETLESVSENLGFGDQETRPLSHKRRFSERRGISWW